MTGNERDTEPAKAAELLAILQYYAEAGVDTVLEAASIDRFADSEGPATGTHKGEVSADAPAPSRQRRSDAAARTATAHHPAASEAPTVSDDAAVEHAREAARRATTIGALREALEGFNDCGLRAGARSTVFADGNPDADVMLIGEAPGRDEDRQGLPFVGRAGQLLDRMLTAIGLDRTTCYITNIIPWRPPGNRTPTPLEIEQCRPFVERHIALADPRLIVLMGNVSTKTLLQTTRGILSIRGTWSRYHPNSDIDVPALPTLHPAYLLRNPAQKRLSWIDFLSVRARLDADSGGS